MIGAMPVVPEEIKALDEKAIRLESLITHRHRVSGSESVEQVSLLLHGQGIHYLGVVDAASGGFLGMVSMQHVNTILSGRYGFSLHARKPVRRYLLPECLAVPVDLPIQDVLDRALRREPPTFHDDIALVDGDETFLGMISVRTLVGLQSHLMRQRQRLIESQERHLRAVNESLLSSLSELRDSQSKYHTVFENSPLGIALVDRDGVCHAVNSRICELLGLPTEAKRQPSAIRLTDYLNPEGQDTFRALLDGSRPGGTATRQSAELGMRIHPGGETLLRIDAEYIPEVSQTCLVVDDITRDRELENRLAKKEKSALLESLVGGIAHELNNKLTPIIGYSDMLNTGAIQSLGRDELLTYSEAIQLSAVEAAKIIRQLLQLSRPATTQFAPGDLRAVVAEALKFLTYKTREAGVRVHFERGGPPVPAEIDSIQIKQVVINLVLNAVHAMSGCPRRDLTITVQSGRRGKSPSTITVADTGHGIPKETLRRIFDPFFTTKGPQEGTGLGLSVCMSIMRIHGGEIDVASTPGQGTTMTLSLPATGSLPSGATSGVNGARRARQLPVDKDNGDHLRVLVVDDEDGVSHMLAETLHSFLPCRVDRSSHAREAMEKVEQNDFELIISDVRMPDIDGIAFYKWVRQRGVLDKTRFLFITGDEGGKEMREEIGRLGIPVLDKPFPISQLVGQCRELLKDRQGTKV